MMNIRTPLAALAAAAVTLGCTSLPSADALDAQAHAMMKASFRSEGIARIDRLDQDLVQRTCSSESPPSPALVRQIEAEAMATIKWPSGGVYLGDWRQGEKLAQNGRGMSWSDRSTDPKDNGAQCYNCHQIGPDEISFGTIGPSLYHYGRNRGVKNPLDPASAAVVQYTWAKLWNSKSHNACTHMPRFGHMGLLDENQIRHLMALLLDPASPVNR
jgi:sulfur-oxidizing protein SoxX